MLTDNWMSSRTDTQDDAMPEDLRYSFAPFLWRARRSAQEVKPEEHADRTPEDAKPTAAATPGNPAADRMGPVSAVQLSMH